MTDEEKRPEAEGSEESGTESAEVSKKTGESNSSEERSSEEKSEEKASEDRAIDSADDDQSKPEEEEAGPVNEAAGEAPSNKDSEQEQQEETSITAASGSASAHGHGGHGDDHFAHTASWQMLVGVFGALIVLTVMTVAVTAIDLGASGNFVVAMIIATVKAALVMGFFMHMIWDNKFNVVAFTSSFLFVLLFLAMALTDRGEYQDSVDSWENDQKSEAMQ